MRSLVCFDSPPPIAISLPRPHPKRRPLQTAEEVVDPTGPSRVIVIAGPGTGAVYPLEDQESVVMGRAQSCACMVAGSDISRRHAALRRQPGGPFVVEDLASRNGTFLNGHPVTEPTPIRFGDRITLGTKSVLLFTHYDSAEEQLLEQQRLELLGRMAAGVAHDLNNLLGAVLATKEYLASLPPDRLLGSDEVLECLADIDVAASRATDLTPRLLHFVRGSDAGRDRLPFSAICHELSQIARRLFDRRIVIDADIEPNLHVVGDRGQVHQIAMNLMVNARDAMPEGGHLRIEARPATACEIRSHDLDAQRGYVVLVVTDTGEGIGEETKERIFEPFFTTKQGRSFGLGLATTKQLLAAHGGHITLDSEPGSGSKFTVFFPDGGNATARKTAPRTPRLSERPPRRRILLADDDASFRKATVRLMRRVGLEVDPVSTGAAALDAYRADGHDVVLVDLDMPDLRGEEVIDRLAEHDPQACVIVLSGPSGGARTDALREARPNLDILQKPIGIDDLQLAIANAPPLDERDPSHVTTTHVRGLTGGGSTESSA